MKIIVMVFLEKFSFEANEPFCAQILRILITMDPVYRFLWNFAKWKWPRGTWNLSNDFPEKIFIWGKWAVLAKNGMSS